MTLGLVSRSFEFVSVIHGLIDRLQLLRLFQKVRQVQGSISLHSTNRPGQPIHLENNTNKPEPCVHKHLTQHPVQVGAQEKTTRNASDGSDERCSGGGGGGGRGRSTSRRQDDGQVLAV